MSRSKNRKIADLISGGTFDDGVVAASEVTGLHTVASTGNFNELENKPTPFDPAADTTLMRRSANSLLNMNNNDIVGVDQIRGEDDSDTYIGFHAPNQFQIVTGGTERLEVNNSRTQIDTLLVTGTATFSGDVEGTFSGPPNFNPSTTPDYNLTSSTTWTVPTNSNALWAVFYLVGGGGGGDLQSTYAPSGSGGAAYLTAMLLEALPSTIQIVVGGGGAGGTASPSNGGNTSVTIGSNIWTAAGGYAGAGTSAILAGNTGSVIMPTGGSQYIFSDGDAQGGSRGRYAGIAGNATYYNGSVLGGGGGRGGGRSDTIAGPSLHAGNGGDLSHRNGYAPGGGGAGIKTASLAPANGADGSVRIWLL